MLPLRALLIDFDGVLADTENIHVAAWQRTLAELGWEVADEICARAAEEDDRTFLASLFAERKIEAGDIDGWVRRKQELTIRLLSDSPRLYPGAVELVARYRGRLTLAVVTGSWRANVETVLKSASLAGDITLIVAKEDVARPKPDPEGYRLALKRLKIKPSQAVALEDSPSGLAAAAAARIAALAVGHRRPQGAWHGGADYVRDLAQAAERLDAFSIDAKP